MHPHSEALDIRPGDEVVTLTPLRLGDVVRMERLDARRVGLRAVSAEEAARSAGPLFRVEAGGTRGSVRLVQVRADGPLN
jgi:hypothetical protein